MTREEAIKRLNLRSVDAAGEAARGNVEALKDLEAYGLAIEALEKQIPKKFSEFDSVWCPNCGKNVFDLSNDCSFNYCPYCGQALDWSEE